MMNVASKLLSLLACKNKRITTVESFTGGALSATICRINGASRVFDRGFVSYSKQAKISIGVDEQLINQYGLASHEVAMDMAVVGLLSNKSDIGISTTGYAGHSNNPNIPRGTVFIAHAYYFLTSHIKSPHQYHPNYNSKSYRFKYSLICNMPLFIESRCFLYTGSREEIINQSIRYSLSHMLSRALDIYK